VFGGRESVAGGAGAWLPRETCVGTGMLGGNRPSLGAAKPWCREGDAWGGDDDTGRVWGLPGPGVGKGMLGEGMMTPAESGGCRALVRGRGCSGRGR